jgi:hypothetical protein
MGTTLNVAQVAERPNGVLSFVPKSKGGSPWTFNPH